jgi:O-antigen ligase
LQNLALSKDFFKKDNIGLINSYLLVLLGFVLPITVAGANIVLVLITILWLVEGDLKKKITELASNKLVLASMAFILVHIVGLLWTEDIKWGLNIVKKEAIFLFLPILMSVAKKEHLKYYIGAFLMAMTISEIVSYGIWLEIIHWEGRLASNPTPFMSHISYNPFLAFAIYILIFFMLFDKSLSNKEKLISSFFIITMSINMFITGGRSGQVVFFVLMVVIFFIYFNKSFLKALLLSMVIVPSVFMIAYYSSSIFKHRVNDGIESIQNFMKYDRSDVLRSSINQRLGYAINSYNILLKEGILLGVGTGDFPTMYKEENRVSRFPTSTNTVHPHNMYILVATQVGVVGLLVLISILYYLHKYSRRINDFYKPIRVGLVVMFAFIMLSDSYLLGHFTTMLFIFFSAILFNNKMIEDGQK